MEYGIEINQSISFQIDGIQLQYNFAPFLAFKDIYMLYEYLYFSVVACYLIPIKVLS